MKKELALLNFICIIAAVGFVVVAVVNLLTSGAVLSTDNLFVTMVCLIMALLFAADPILYLRSEGKLPVPFLKGSTSAPQITSSSSGSSVSSARLPAALGAPLLDAKGRAVPPDVRALMTKMGQAESKEA